MSQNTLIEKIQADAAKAVADIKANSAAAVATISSETEAEVEELNLSHKVALQKTKEQMELVAVSKAKQAGKIAVQSAKREQIDAIFAGVIKDLSEQSADDYVAFFSKHLEAVVPKDLKIEVVMSPKNREDETTKILKEAGLSGEVKADPQVTSGLMIMSTDGVYDVTLARILEEKRAELEAMVVNQVMS